MMTRDYLYVGMDDLRKHVIEKVQKFIKSLLEEDLVETDFDELCKHMAQKVRAFSKFLQEMNYPSTRMNDTMRSRCIREMEEFLASHMDDLRRRGG